MISLINLNVTNYILCEQPVSKHKEYPLDVS